MEAELRRVGVMVDVNALYSPMVLEHSLQCAEAVITGVFNVRCYQGDIQLDGLFAHSTSFTGMDKRATCSWLNVFVVSGGTDRRLLLRRWGGRGAFPRDGEQRDRNRS